MQNQSKVRFACSVSQTGLVLCFHQHQTSLTHEMIMISSCRAIARKSLPENSAREMPVIRGIPRCFRRSGVLNSCTVACACQHDSVNSPLIISSTDYHQPSALHSCVNGAFAFKYRHFFNGRVMQTICKNVSLIPHRNLSA